MRVGILAFFSSLITSFYGQVFLGEISGNLDENGFISEFTWRFEEEKTYYILKFELEHEEHRIEITFDGDTSATVEIFEDDQLSEARGYTPADLKKDIKVLSETHADGPQLLNRSTEKYSIKTAENEIEACMSDISVNWNGADYFFAGDIPFALVSLEKGKFPLKIVSKDFQGNIDYSMEVTSIVKK